MLPQKNEQMVRVMERKDSQPLLISRHQKPILQKNGKPVLRKSYSVLQVDLFNEMQTAGYNDVLRGERGSTAETLIVTPFKVQRVKRRMANIQKEKPLWWMRLIN